MKTGLPKFKLKEAMPYKHFMAPTLKQKKNKSYRNSRQKLQNELQRELKNLN